ncbi:MAG: retention module-containing protein, partial [Desulfobulbus sp.]|nr:retention module-containing protein [Desulfobulbus sp.]
MAAQIYAKVASLTGEAYARNAAGQLRLLKVGDIIREGESVITTDGSQVVLQLADGRQMALVPGDVVRIDAEVAADFKPDATDSAVASGHQTLNHVSEALARGENLDDMLDPTAAGNVGPANQGHSFVELARIVENVTPLAYAYATERGSVQGEFDGGRVLPASTNVQTDNTSPVEPQPPEPPKPVDPEPPEPPKPVDPEPPEPPKPVDPEPQQPENHIPG